MEKELPGLFLSPAWSPWKTLKRSDLNGRVMDLTFMENLALKPSVLFCSWCRLSELLSEGGECASAMSHCFCFFLLSWGFRGIQMADASLWSQERTVVFVFTGLSFCNYSPTHQAPEATWDEWFGVRVGSTLSGLHCLDQREATNDSMVAGSRFGALVCFYSSTLSSLFSPLCLTVCEKYVPCGLVGAVKWWLCLSDSW